MPWRTDLLPFLKLQRYAGLLSARPAADGQRPEFEINRTTRWLAIVITCSISCLIEALFVFVASISAPGKISIYSDGSFGNNLIFYQLLICAVLQMCISLNTLIYSERHVQLIQKVLALGNVFCLKQHDCASLKRRLRLQYMLLIVLTLFSFVNIPTNLASTGLPQIVCMCMATIICSQFFFGALIMSTFMCVVHIFETHLHCCNREIGALISQRNANVNDSHSVRVYLRKRMELISMLHINLTEVYGLPLLFQAGCTLTTIPSLPYILITMIPNLQALSGFMFFYFIKISLGMIMPFAYFVQVLCNDSILKEANKTAKILSKMPRTGSGLDRMVEKFLLKNIRQQPILTAYGFFTLDKSTLFKLFTAIFTYMVILIQFKEMENSTRQLQATHHQP